MAWGCVMVRRSERGVGRLVFQRARRELRKECRLRLKVGQERTKEMGDDTVESLEDVGKGEDVYIG